MNRNIVKCRISKKHSLKISKITGNSLIQSFYFGFTFVILYAVIPKIDLEDRLTTITSLGLKSYYLPRTISFDSYFIRIFGIPVFSPDTVLGTKMPFQGLFSQISGPFYLLGLNDMLFRIFIIFVIGFIMGIWFPIPQNRIEQNWQVLLFRVLAPCFLYLPFLVLLHLNDWFIYSVSILNLFLISILFLSIENSELGNLKLLSRKRNSLLLLIFILLPYGQLSMMSFSLFLLSIHYFIWSSKWMTFLKGIRLNIFQFTLLFMGCINVVLTCFQVYESYLQDNSPRILDPLRFSLGFSNGRTLTLPLIVSTVLILYTVTDSLWLKIRRMIFLITSTSFLMSPLGDLVSVSGKWILRDFVWFYTLCIFSIKVLNKSLQNQSSIINKSSTKAPHRMFYLGVLSLSANLVLTYSIFLVNYVRDFDSKVLSVSNSSNSALFVDQSRDFAGKRFLTFGENLNRTPFLFEGRMSKPEFAHLGIGLLSGWTKLQNQSFVAQSDKKYENKAWITNCNLELIRFLSPDFIFIRNSDVNCIEKISSSIFFRDVTTKFTDTDFDIFKLDSFSMAFIDEASSKSQYNSCYIYQEPCQAFWNYLHFQTSKSSAQNVNFIALCKDLKFKGWCINFNEPKTNNSIILPIKYYSNLYSMPNGDTVKFENWNGFLKVSGAKRDLRISYKPSLLDYTYAVIGWIYLLISLIVLLKVSLPKIHKSRV